MSEESKKVLEMVAAGKLTAEEAERLLEKLSDRGDDRREGHRRRWGRVIHKKVGPLHAAAVVMDDDDGEEPGGARELPRYLRVVVDGAKGETVNIRIPLKLIRTGIKLGAMLPTDAKEKIEAKGIDLSSFGDMEVEELMEALDELSVDVESGEETVRIFCE